jgi:AcrR family transcriptional regulator
VVDVGKLVDVTAARRLGARVTPVSAGGRRTRVVLAAVTAVEEVGPGVGMGEIAERAGIPRPHLYRLFRSKEQLDSEVVRYAADALVGRVRPHLARGGTPGQIIRGVVEPSVGWAAEHPQLYRFLATQRQTRALHGARTGRSRFLTDVAETLAAYLRAGNLDAEIPDGILAGLMGMVDAAIIWWLDHGDEAGEALVDRLSRHVLLVLTDVMAQAGLTVPLDLELHLSE